MQMQVGGTVSDRCNLYLSLSLCQSIYMFWSENLDDAASAIYGFKKKYYFNPKKWAKTKHCWGYTHPKPSVCCPRSDSFHFAFCCCQELIIFKVGDINCCKWVSISEIYSRLLKIEAGLGIQKPKHGHNGHCLSSMNKEARLWVIVLFTRRCDWWTCKLDPRR